MKYSIGLKNLQKIELKHDTTCNIQSMLIFSFNMIQTHSKYVNIFFNNRILLRFLFRCFNVSYLMYFFKIINFF